MSPEDIKELLSTDREAWKAEISDIENHFASFGDHLPDRLKKQLQEFIQRLG
jgi:phosphoenolpyruvate carboxykinase (GTP)